MKDNRPIPDQVPDYLRDVWSEVRDQCKPSTPTAAIEAMARQLYLLRDAERRITEEGSVIVDGKGNATEHPAIKIQRDAGKEVREWLKRWGSR